LEKSFSSPRNEKENKDTVIGILQEFLPKVILLRGKNLLLLMWWWRYIENFSKNGSLGRSETSIK